MKADLEIIDAAWAEPSLVATAHRELGHLYFIQMGDNGPVKIGRAKDPERRLAALQAANPEKLNLRASWLGQGRFELRLHQLLVDHRIRGEWFEPAPRLLELAEKGAEQYWMLDRLDAAPEDFSIGELIALMEFDRMVLPHRAVDAIRRDLYMPRLREELRSS